MLINGGDDKSQHRTHLPIALTRTEPFQINRGSVYGGTKTFFNDGDTIELKVARRPKREVDDVVRL